MLLERYGLMPEDIGRLTEAEYGAIRDREKVRETEARRG